MIILTAAVAVNPSVVATVVDTSQRFDQYLRAVADWRRIADAVECDLAVVETSGYSTKEWSQKGAICLSHIPTDEIATRGKGAIEAFALDMAIQELDLDAGLTIHKVTGRLMLRNWQALVLPTKERQVRIRRTIDRSYCDTRFFSLSAGEWSRTFTGMADEVRDQRGVYLEHVVAQRLVESEYKGEMCVERFPTRPALVGVSGTSGRSYGSALKRGLAKALGPVETELARRSASKQI